MCFRIEARPRVDLDSCADRVHSFSVVSGGHTHPRGANEVSHWHGKYHHSPLAFSTLRGANEILPLCIPTISQRRMLGCGRVDLLTLAGLTVISLPQPPKCWATRQEPPSLNCLLRFLLLTVRCSFECSPFDKMNTLSRWASAPVLTCFILTVVSHHGAQYNCFNVPAI